MATTATRQWWRVCATAAVALLAGAMLLTACDTSTTTGRAGQSSPSSAPGAVTLADLLSAQVPSLCLHAPGRLVNGDLPLQNPVYGEVSIAQQDRNGQRTPLVAFGDLTGDGVADGALVTACTAGGVGWPATVQLYSRGGQHLGGVDLGDVTHGREIVESITISDGMVHVDWLTNGPDEPSCCPTVRMSGDIRWDGQRVAIANVHKTGAQQGSMSVLAPLYERAGNYYFTSPSGKFSCGIIRADTAPSHKAAAGCHGPTQPIPPRPSTCPSTISWGKGMQVNSDGAVSFICTGGVIYAPGSGTDPPSLDYGRTLSINGFSCSTATTGVTCKNDASGHGFIIADSSHRTF